MEKIFSNKKPTQLSNLEVCGEKKKKKENVTIILLAIIVLVPQGSYVFHISYLIGFSYVKSMRYHILWLL